MNCRNCTVNEANVSMLKAILKYFLYIFLLLFLLLGIAISGVYVFKDDIIQLFVNQANKQLNTKVFVEKIDIEFWETFPYISLDFKDLKIMEPTNGGKESFIEAENLFVSLSYRDLLNKKYKIKQLYVQNGKFNFEIYKDGTDNFSAFKESSDTVEQTIVFDLKDIKCSNTSLVYVDENSKNKYDVKINKGNAKFRFNDEDWDITLKVDVFSNEIKLNNLTFFKNKPANLVSSIVYSKKSESYKILPSSLEILNAIFKVEGLMNFSKRAYVDLKFSEQNSDFQTIISFLPAKFSQTLALYKSKGDVYFNGIIKGYIYRGQKPLVRVKFGCKNASFFHPDAKEGITNSSFKGEYHNAQGTENSFFKLENITAKLRDKSLSGNLLLTNLSNPSLKFDLKTSLDANYLLTVFPNEQVESAKGNLTIDVFFKGNLDEIKKKNYQNVESFGKVQIDQVSLKLKNKSTSLANLNALFEFTKSDLKALDFNCEIGRSDFHFKGMLTNIIPYLLYPNSHLKIDGDYQSNLLDISELQNDQSRQKSALVSAFSFPSKVDFDLRCTISRLLFHKYTPKNISGDIHLHHNVFEAKNLKMNIANGILKAEGTLMQKKDSSFAFNSKMVSDAVDIDSIFLINDNFAQKFISSSNLKGKLTSEVNISFATDKYLNINTNSLSATIDMSIANGQLLNFGPMKNLSKFVDEEALSNISFSELKNNFLITNRTVFIPEMSIKSSINTTQIQGNHTFDNRFEYRIKLPLKNYKKKHNLGEEEAIEGDIFRGFYLYLIIKGTPDDYKISYDKGAVTQKIKEKWQEEKKEFIDLFKKDYSKKQLEKQKVQQLNEDEYME